MTWWILIGTAVLISLGLVAVGFGYSDARLKKEDDELKKKWLDDLNRWRMRR
jgi:hypothetical protein